MNASVTDGYIKIGDGKYNLSGGEFLAIGEKVSIYLQPNKNMYAVDDRNHQYELKKNL
jgi:hypothetical protein